MQLTGMALFIGGWVALDRLASGYALGLTPMAPPQGNGKLNPLP